MLEMVFEERGYEVFAFSGPSHCPLGNISSCPCPPGTICADVILSDVQMARDNGIDFIEKLMTKGCRRPWFGLMSGSWSPDDRARAELLGCMLFDKPFQIRQIVAWLECAEKSISLDRQFFGFNWQSGQGSRGCGGSMSELGPG